MQVPACPQGTCLEVSKERPFPVCKNYSLQPRADMPWVETEFDADFRQYILDFPKDQLPVIYRLIEQYRTARSITIFHSVEEADAWLASL